MDDKVSKRPRGTARRNGRAAQRDKEPPTPEVQLRRQIDRISSGARLKYREQLARRLEFLLEAMGEDGEVWQSGSPQSLQNLLQFLDTVRSFSEPTITVTPDATFRAEWSHGEDAHFAANFLPDGQVRFVVFCPNPRHRGQVQRLSGLTTWDTLKQAVSPYRVERWAIRDG